MKDNLQNENNIRLKKSNSLLYRIIKRLFDIIFSCFLLLFLLPIFIVVSLIIVIDDGFPIFFKQVRSGKNDVPFSMFKFRSMKNKQVPVASNTHDDYNWTDGVPDDFVFKAPSEHNPNITKIGQFIRKYSIDELPQLINVLKGEMSMIGPRPEIIAISKHYNDYQRQRLFVKPGITGWSQVNGRSDMDHGTKIKHDLYYVEHASIFLDVKILIKTFTQVIRGDGAV